MAQCAYCKAETETYEGGDVPICLECSDARQAKIKPPASEQVGRLLIQESVEATSRANAALRAFNDVLNLFPSGLPNPDGTQRVQNASRKLIAARKEMGRAHSRLNDFLSRGIMPEDLKRRNSS
jgi:hypothetical protein